jgi:hypothetical protein
MIKRYYATQNNTITNAYLDGLSTKATGSNTGQADILEVFTIYGQVSASATGYSKEKSRILIKFDMEKVQSDRNDGTVPTDATYYLKMYNASHSSTLPKNYNLEVCQLSADWQEGVGVDLESRSDITYDVRGSNWIKRSGSTSWSSQGGDVTGTPITATLPVGNEDIEVNITPMISSWLSNNYGALIRISSSQEDQSASYYTKRFYGRGSNRYFDRPVLEARWDDSKRDDRGQFYTSSSLAPAADNLNTLYLYNYVRGRLTNIPSIGTGLIYVNLYSTLGSTAETLCLNTPATGGYVSTGIYSCSVCIDTTSDTLYDVWHSGSTEYHTGTISADSLSSYVYSDTEKYVLSVSNRQSEYYYDQTHRVRLYARRKGWSPNIYTTANTIPNSLTFRSASYQIYRVIDDRVVVPYDTGSSQATRLSYDVSGNYFDLDTSYLEPNYSYGTRFSVYDPDTGTYEEQPYTYKFRVVKNEY